MSLFVKDCGLINVHDVAPFAEYAWENIKVDFEGEDELYDCQYIRFMNRIYLRSADSKRNERVFADAEIVDVTDCIDMKRFLKVVEENKRQQQRRQNADDKSDNDDSDTGSNTRVFFARSFPISDLYSMYVGDNKFIGTVWCVGDEEFYKSDQNRPYHITGFGSTFELGPFIPNLVAISNNDSEKPCDRCMGDMIPKNAKVIRDMVANEGLLRKVTVPDNPEKLPVLEIPRTGFVFPYKAFAEAVKLEKPTEEEKRDFLDGLAKM